MKTNHQRVVCCLLVMASLLFVPRPVPVTASESGNGSSYLAGSGYLRPRVSPDGRSIAYLSYDADGERLSLKLRRTDAASTAERVLAQHVNEASDVAWRPSGGALAVLREMEGRNSLDVISETGTVLHSIPLPSSALEGGLAWLADGQQIVVGSGASLMIMMMNSAAGEIVSTIDLTRSGLSPDLSVISASKGDRFAFAATRSGETERGARIWVIEARRPESSSRPITAGPTDASPEWTGESSVVFSREDPSARWKRGSAQYSLRHLWETSVPDGTERQLTRGQVRDDYPTWVSSKDILVFSRIAFDALKSDKQGASTAVTSKPLSTILESISQEVLFMARESQVAWIPHRR